MKKADLHVHSKYSEHPSEWFLQRLGAMESYTEPEYIYRTAMARGMDFVTITDHNRIDGALRLQQQYPHNTFVSMETTTYFPEDECKIHILVYGITEQQFNDIDSIRSDIYTLRDYIRDNDIAYSVAHATYSINAKLTIDHLEKLILLFDVFEGINGARDYLFNNNWMLILKNLTPQHIARLRLKHDIEPMSDDPWIKGFTGGSDDHAGLFIGKTCTEARARTVKDLLHQLRSKQTLAAGRHNDYKCLAFAIYKIAWDFANQKKDSATNSFAHLLTENIFGVSQFNLKKEIRFETMKTRARKNRIGELMIEATDEIRKLDPSNIDRRFEIVFEKISDIADEFFFRIFSSVQQDIRGGDITSLVMNLSSSLPGLFLSLPFLSAQKHMHHNRGMIRDLKADMGIKPGPGSRKILWFTDTVSDLNGVSETIREISWLSYNKNRDVRIVLADAEPAGDGQLPPNAIRIPTFHSFKLPAYEECELHLPSILRTIEQIYREQPSEIIVSTPGPVGVLGLVCARLLNIKCTGIYHTDFTSQINDIVGDAFLTAMVERATRRFYSLMDTIKVPTAECRSLLVERGFDNGKLEMLTKGLNADIFCPVKDARTTTTKKYGLKKGPTLIYAGRVSKDKNLDFLGEIYRVLQQTHPDLNLIIAGDGPYLEQLKPAMQDCERVIFTGRLRREDLPPVYSAADLFVFPSTTDTFGMAVMEAQACGLPAVVSDSGGPQEIIEAGQTGLIARSTDLDDWCNKVSHYLETLKYSPAAFAEIKARARRNVIRKFNMDESLRSYFGQLESAPLKKSA